MTSNDIVRRIRYIFDYSDSEMIALFKLANLNVNHDQVNAWLRKEDDPMMVEINTKELATFLNGLIIEKRGKREGPQPEPETILNNNIILRKLKIAFNLKSEDMIVIFALGDKKISKPELSAFFRKTNHTSYRACLNQYLRCFFNGLQAKYGAAPSK